MLRRVLVACAAFLAFALCSPAQAGVPIPCSGSHVLQARHVDASGREMVLYYDVVACTVGPWHGYRGADGKYRKLMPNELSSLPQTPGFWASAWQNKAAFLVEWLWVLIGAFAVIGGLLSKYAEMSSSGVLSPGEKPPSVRSR
jgi:hypothetical protein